MSDRLDGLRALSHEQQDDAVAGFSVEELEALAVELYEEYSGLGYQVIPRFGLLDVLLSERVSRLNKDFEWTEERRNRFLEISDGLTSVFLRAYKEASSALEWLRFRMRHGDAFLADCDVKIRMNFYAGESVYVDEGCFWHVLSEPLEGHAVGSYTLGEAGETPIYLDSSLNWNIEYFGGVFDDCYIGYMIHALLDSGRWSFSDILSIERVWADVVEKRQHVSVI